MSDDHELGHERSALEILNAIFDDSGQTPADSVRAIVLENPTVPPDKTIANLLYAMTNLATLLVGMRIEDLGKTPSQTLDQLGELLAG